MKEILYVQAGPFANFVGTHFWNTQESYFTYGEGDDPIVFHDRSFREGLTHEGESTYCPRLLLFDRKSNFGALSDALYGTEEVPEVPQWEGDVVEFRQDLIPKSEYQLHLDEESAEYGKDPDNKDAEAQEASEKSIRFWSDYSRVYFHPRSIQKLPDLADWESADGEWNSSRQTFQEYEAEHELMDNEVRLFVEECDELQGIQLTVDSATFGGFTDSFLTALRDEHPKLSSIVFPCLSNASNSIVTTEEIRQAAKAINDALLMRSLENLSSLNVPIQSPLMWTQGDWLHGLDIDLKSIYQTSAIVSTHIENVTLPYRLKNSLHDISSMSGYLTASGTMRTAHLAGMYPMPVSLPWNAQTEKRIFDLSAVADVSDKRAPVTEYARLHVSRGLRSSEVPQHDELFSTKMPALVSIHAPAYPTRSSFPRFFSPLSDPRLSREEYREAQHRVLSTLTTSSSTARLWASYARLAQECVDRRAEVVERMGLEIDEVRELKDDMWALCDLYVGDAGEGDSEGEELGEDEE